MAYRLSQSVETDTTIRNRWRDIDLSFDQNPITLDIKVLTNENSIRASVKNLILTNLHERPFQPDIGCTIRSILFDPLTPILALRVKKVIENTLRNDEPRITLINTLVVGDPDKNTIEISIEFRILNYASNTLVNFSLKRTR